MKFCSKVLNETDIEINVISGSEEAQILYETHLADNLDAKFNYLYIDVGGGSTELTLYTVAKEVVKKSFNIGTIRLIKDSVDDETWDDMKLFIKSDIKIHLPAFKPLVREVISIKYFLLSKK
jgi:exopolyphosphatase/guanosine-5'-triphosphate,3'-diphosphate pyrophosphatase